MRRKENFPFFFTQSYLRPKAFILNLKKNLSSLKSWGWFIKKKSLACFSAFSLSHSLISHRLLCVCLCVCVRARVLKRMCVSILVAATRSYSRSTGALHTPDTFGAAGEGWVHLFLRTSPTHFASIFVRSVFFSVLLQHHASPHVFFVSLFLLLSIRLRGFLFCFFYILLQDVERCSGIACFRQFSCQLTTILSVLPMPIFILYLALPLLCRDINTFSCVFCQTFFSPQWCLRRHLTCHYINLQGYSWEM